MTRGILAAAAVAFVGLTGCRSDNAIDAQRNASQPATERQNVSGTERPGTSTFQADPNAEQKSAERQNQAGAVSPEIAPAGVDASGGGNHYKVDRIDKSAQKIYFRLLPGDPNRANAKDLQSGRDIVLTFAEFESLAAIGNRDLNDVVKEGNTVMITRDQKGKVTKVLVEEKK